MLFEAAKLPSAKHAILFPPFLNLLIKRLLDAGYVAIQKNIGGGINASGLQISPDFLRITDKGREFIASLSLDSGN